MQIQRLQNLYLLIAFIAAILSLSYPFVYVTGGSIGVKNNVPLLILGLMATILPLLALCLYKNLQRQKLVSRVAALFADCTLVYAVVLYFISLDLDNGANIALFSPICIFLSSVFDLLAARAIHHDQELLKAADRIR